MSKHNTRHLMAYVKWEVIEKWKKQEKSHGQYQSGKAGERAPYAYGSAQCCLYTLAEPGTIIWIVSSPHFSDRLLPPTIIARLCVRKRINRKDSSYDSTEIPTYFDKKWNYIVLAESPPESFYLPLNNASKFIVNEIIFKNQKKALINCSHCDKLRRKTDMLFSGIPSHLQTIREVVSSKGEELTTWVKNFQSGKNVFLSYKHCEARELAEYLAEKISDYGIGCWWDEWNLSLEALDGKKLKLSRAKLKSNLIDGLRQSAYMMALVTKKYYNKKSWTLDEWEHAIYEQKDKGNYRTRRLQIVEVLLDGKRSNLKGIIFIDARNLRKQEIATKIINIIS